MFGKVALLAPKNFFLNIILFHIRWFESEMVARQSDLLVIIYLPNSPKSVIYIRLDPPLVESLVKTDHFSVFSSSIIFI